MQYNAMQYDAIQYNAMQYNTTLFYYTSHTQQKLAAKNLIKAALLM